MNELRVYGRARGVNCPFEAALDDYRVTTIDDTAWNDPKVADISQNALEDPFHDRLGSDVRISVRVAQAFGFSPFDLWVKRVQHSRYVTLGEGLVDSSHDVGIHLASSHFRRCRQRPH